MTTDPTRILFICMGNICRSPTAEVVFHAQVRAAGLEQLFAVDSAGTTDWHQGEPPDSRSVLAAADRLYDMSNLRARQITDLDFEDFDHIYAMDQINLEALQDLCPLQYQHKLELLLTYGHTGWREVPDPYNSGLEGFELVLDLTETACCALLAELQQKYPSGKA